MAFIEPCFGIGHNLSLICQMTSEDIKHQLIITDNDVEPPLNSVFENPSIDANRKAAMFAFYPLKRREEMLAS